jgi:uncharacterized protein (TIGR00255 family)
MIRSMTGYGKAECHLPDKKLTIEIRSLNSKQMDTNARLPSLYKEKELEIRQMITAGLDRGKVECSFHYEIAENASSGTINEAVVKDYYEQLYKIAGELGLPTSPELLSTVLRLPDTIRTEKAGVEDEEWIKVKEALEHALEQVRKFRNQEGLSLEKDLKERVGAISEKLEKVAGYEASRMEQIRERIGNNLEEFEEKESLDENRFEQELIYYLEKLDISEEKVRLANHCNYFLETLARVKALPERSWASSPRRWAREINTLGSKANHRPSSRSWWWR